MILLALLLSSIVMLPSTAQTPINVPVHLQARVTSATGVRAIEWNGPSVAHWSNKTLTVRNTTVKTEAQLPEALTVSGDLIFGIDMRFTKQGSYQVTFKATDRIGQVTTGVVMVKVTRR